MSTRRPDKAWPALVAAVPHIAEGLGWEAIELSDTTVRLQGNTAIVNGKIDMQRNKDKPDQHQQADPADGVGEGEAGLADDRPVRRPDDDQVIAANAALAAVAAKAAPAAAAAPAK
jgi:hypothetical protein